MTGNSFLFGLFITAILLVSVPASEEYTLGIFGNANEDDTIEVQNDDDYMMAFLDIATGGSGCLIGTAYMAKWFHPELKEVLNEI